MAYIKSKLNSNQVEMVQEKEKWSKEARDCFILAAEIAVKLGNQLEGSKDYHNAIFFYRDAAEKYKKADRREDYKMNLAKAMELASINSMENAYLIETLAYDIRKAF